jgi:CubicO group peptidase (beta-lactamase class C family)
MATGNYASAGYEVDEGSASVESDFFSVNTYSQKATHACNYPRKAPPGTTWAYHTSDTFLLGSALNTIYKQKEGDTKDYYRDMLVPELWKPLKMSPTTWTSTRTIDDVAYPVTGYGLTFHHDDMVKIGEFLNKNNASISGVEMLDSTLYNEAMQRTSKHGLSAGAAKSKYLHGFWAWDAGSTDSGEAICPNAKWIPYMSGFGGIGLVLLPNNMVYYFVSDNHEYAFKKAMIELNKIRNICN